MTSNRLSEEPLIGLAAAARQCPDGQTRSPQSLWRWCRVGVRGTDGTVVRLEHLRAPDRLLTSVAAILRFFERLAAEPDGDEQPNGNGRASPKRKPRRTRTHLAADEAACEQARI